MPTKSATLARARSGLGVTESPAGSNQTKFNEWFYGRMLAAKWCAIWVCWVLIGAGFTIRKNAGAFALGEYLSSLKGWKRVEPGEIVGGDIVVYTFSHIGICEAKRADGTLYVDEGNHNDRSGRVVRKLSEIDYGVRPPYEPEPAIVPAPRASRRAKVIKDFTLLDIKTRKPTHIKGGHGGTVAILLSDHGLDKVTWGGHLGWAPADHLEQL